MFENAVILGPGLLGASLLQAWKNRGLAARTGAWARRPEVRLRCLEAPWCDAAHADPGEAVAGADLIVACVPVEQITPLFERIAAHLRPGALVTDVGSTKSLICRESAGLFPANVTFIGSHPMAGSEKSGLDNAREDLFEGRACFVTPLPDTPEPLLERLVTMWRRLGMEVGTTSPEQHDETVAHISHLPHFLASALCAYLASRDAQWHHYAGPGLRDTTRVAAGDPGMWKAIARHNREEIIRALDGLDGELHRLRTALVNNDMLAVEHLLKRGKTYRDAL